MVWLTAACKDSLSRLRNLLKEILQVLFPQVKTLSLYFTNNKLVNPCNSATKLLQLLEKLLN